MDEPQMAALLTLEISDIDFGYTAALINFRFLAASCRLGANMAPITWG
jgi:hypothetical protein